MPGILLKDALERENNNMDIFRLLAATAVIVGHTYALSPQPGAKDIVEQIFGFTYSGAYAVKIFFFLSGLVVTNSLLEKKNWFNFLLMRFFRLVPGLIVAVSLSAFLLGPLVTTNSIGEYFHSKETYLYVAQNSVLKATYSLPGVFTNTPYQHVVNGSLWTLRWEVWCYLVLIAFFLLGAFKHKTTILVLFIVLTVEILLPERLLLKSLTNNPEWFLPPWCFAFGALLAAYKTEFQISREKAAAAVLACLLLKGTLLFEISLYLATFLSLLWLSTVPIVKKLRPSSDISYGVYLWGFPVQQTLVFYTGVELGIFPHMVLAILITYFLGWTSWHVVEKPSMNIAKKFQKQISQIQLSKNSSL